MKIWQIKEISSSVHKTFSDELKLKMINQQFAFAMEHHDEVRQWLIENMKHPYMLDYFDKAEPHAWVQFTNEEDAVAFKLRWS